MAVMTLQAGQFAQRVKDGKLVFFMTGTQVMDIFLYQNMLKELCS